MGQAEGQTSLWVAALQDTFLGVWIGALEQLHRVMIPRLLHLRMYPGAQNRAPRVTPAFTLTLPLIFLATFFTNRMGAVATLWAILNGAVTTFLKALPIFFKNLFCRGAVVVDMVASIMVVWEASFSSWLVSSFAWTDGNKHSMATKANAAKNTNRFAIAPSTRGLSHVSSVCLWTNR